MHIHVLGLGPVGSLIAHHLRLSLPTDSHSITLIHKNSRQAFQAATNGGTIQVRRDGTTTTSRGFGSEVFETTNTSDSPSRGLRSNAESGATASSSSEKISSLFVAIKSQHTLPAISRLAPRLTPHCTIVLMQNGMGTYEGLVKNVFKNPLTRPKFILTVNTHGAYFKGLHDVVHSGVGEIEYAIVPDGKPGVDFEREFYRHPPSERREGLIADIPIQQYPAEYASLHSTLTALKALRSTPLSPTWVPISDLHISMMRKLAVNAVINPLTALMNCRNGDLFNDQASLRIMRRVCAECSSLFKKQLEFEAEMNLKSARRHLHSQDDVDAEVGRFPAVLEREALEAECLRVAQLTSGNISSMLADIRKGRDTEVGSINGYLDSLGQRHHINIPATRMLMELVKMRTNIPLDQMF